MGFIFNIFWEVRSLLFLLNSVIQDELPSKTWLLFYRAAFDLTPEPEGE
jgi:hypothetical protein